MSVQIEIVTMPPQFIAIVRARTSPQAIGDDQRKCFRQVMAYLQKKHMQPAGPPVSFYFQMESATVWNIGAGYPIASKIDSGETVEVIEIPAGKFATLLHTGPYYGLKDSWQALEAWHKEQGYTVEKEFLSWESYLTHPDDEPDESKLQARLYWKL